MKRICLILTLLCILGLLAACAVEKGPAETGAAPGTTAAPATDGKTAVQGPGRP